jgi:hypothetical protein
VLCDKELDDGFGSGQIWSRMTSMVSVWMILLISVIVPRIKEVMRD